MKFKVGDKVRCISIPNEHRHSFECNKVKVGSVIRVDSNRSWPFECIWQKGHGYGMPEECFELANSINISHLPEYL